MKAPRFWDQPPGFLSAVLTPLSWGYRLGARVRRLFARPLRASIPVICVGNAVMGGAGKTPTVQALVRVLQAAGHTPHIVMRGYGGTEPGPLLVTKECGPGDVGDEALILWQSAPTWIARDRALGVSAAAALGADVVVLDDGLQNPTLHKDISILVVDGQVGFGNGCVFPAGPLRETLARAFDKTDAVVVVGKGSVSLPQKPQIQATITPNPDDVREILKQPVVAFAGIGRPQKFFDTLESIGAHVVETHSFADHAPYTVETLEALEAHSLACGARLVTTEKDWVRLPHDFQARALCLRITLDCIPSLATVLPLRRIGGKLTQFATDH